MCVCVSLVDIIIGVPSLQAHNLDAKIREERCRYLVAELVCRVRHIYSRIFARSSSLVEFGQIIFSSVT